MSRISRRWRAATGIVVVGAIAAACAPGTRASSSGSAGVNPAQTAPSIVAPAVQTPAPTAVATTAPAPAKPVAPAAGATQDPQVTADAQATDATLSQIESDLSSLDQATNTGENDVPSN